MDILRKIKSHGALRKDQTAVRGEGESLTYGQLEEYSNRLAAWIREEYPQGNTPVVVYGHKNPFMLVCFLACVKAGRAYCPVDISVPAARVKMILDMVQAPVVLAVSPLEQNPGNAAGLEHIKRMARSYIRELGEEHWVQDDDVFYIIFTSGSTGMPKGVQITYSCLNHYLDWAVNLGSSQSEKEGKVFLNQAPFSFDLSVMDLYTCMACGGTLWTLDKKTQGDYASLLEALAQSKASVWVSTPSFADICLSDQKFNGELMENLEVFLFCGETLTNRTAENLGLRFPKAKVINTYGPTESTVAMTDVEITGEVLRRENPLPVGRPKPGTLVHIMAEDGTLAKPGQRGEIVILGDTVSAGYYKQPELTEKVFFRGEDGIRGYRTGDEGYLKDGMLYYCGRMDLQVKLHGYRIELEDIESNLLKLEGVHQAVVVPRMQEGKVKSLAAFLVGDTKGLSSFQASQEIKGRLRQFLPDYMIPKKITFLEQIPMNTNGKADRKYLKGLLS